MYNKIYDFCKVRNTGGVYKNSPSDPTPRVKFLMDLLDSEGIEYELDTFPIKNRMDDEPFIFPGLGKRLKSKPKPKIEPTEPPVGYNIVMKGTSSRMVIAHHDVANPTTDNANDNSCSCINAIMIKKLMPNIHVVLTDGEEVGGLGSKRLSDRINDGDFGKIDWVLNLELTGKGGKHFFIGNYPGKLQDHIKSLFDCPIVQTPYNDSVTLRRNGIDSLVINPIPPLPMGEKSNVKWDDETFLDFSLVFNCHSSKDSIRSIDVNDMKEFVEQVALKILQ